MTFSGSCYNAAMRPLTFLRTFWNTFSRPSYYIDILKAPLQFSLRFAVIFILFLSILATALFRLRTIPLLVNSLGQNLAELKQNYPSELEIDWNGQRVASNKSPLYLPYPKGVMNETLPPSFAVLDTRDLGSDEVAKQYGDYFFVLSQKNIFVQNQAHQWKDIPIADFIGSESSYHITKDTVTDWNNTVPEQARNWLKSASLFYPLLWSFLFIVSRGIALSLNAVMLWFILRIIGQRIRFAKLWQIMLHCLLVSETAGLIAALLYGHTPFPISNLVFWLYFLVVFAKIHRHPALLQKSASDAAGQE